MASKVPIVRASVLTGFERFLVARGVDAAALMVRAGLSSSTVADPENSLPVNSVVRLMEQAAEATGDPCVGLTFAETFTPGGTGVYGYLINNSLTVDDALNTAARFAGLLGQPFDVHYDKDRDGAVLWWCWPQSIYEPKKQYTSFALALLVGRLQQLSKGSWEPVFVELPHEPLTCQEKARRVFGNNIHYNSERVAVGVDAATLTRPLLTADKRLKPILQVLGERMIANMPPVTNFAETVAAVLRTQLADRRATLEVVAERLGYTTRVLQSRLTQEGTTFEGILNDARKQRAEVLLKDTELTMTEIAIALGFSELSSFTRAAQRWYGESPSAHRQKLRSG